MKTLTLIRNGTSRVWLMLLVFVGNAYAELPESAGDVLPEGIAEDKPPGDIFLSMISWAVVILAYALMASAVVAGGYYLITAFGRASETKGGYGGFAVTAIGVLLMISVVVALGVIGADWGKGIADVSVDG